MRKITKITVFYDDGTFEDVLSPVFPKEKKVDPAPYRIDSPWTLPYNPYEPKWGNPSVCSKCGLKLDSVMGYVCNNNPCPTGMGGTRCGAGTNFTSGGAGASWGVKLNDS